MTDALQELTSLARLTGGMLTIVGNYTASATRGPDPDWSAHLVWIAGEPPEPVTIYGTGASPQQAARAALDQFDPNPQPTQENYP